MDADYINRINTEGLRDWHKRQTVLDDERPTVKWRWKVILSAGGKCVSCGFTPTESPQLACMDFHHRDPASKSFTLGIGAMRRPWDLVQAEIAKCDLVCANCHRIIHYGLGSRRAESKFKMKKAYPAYQGENESERHSRERRNEALRRRILGQHSKLTRTSPAIVERSSA